MVPVTILLFLQWPLRDLLHRWSAQANDAAQWVFALYAAAAVTYASRSGAHLALHSGEPDEKTGTSAWRRMAVALCLLPWAGLMLVAGTPMTWRSIVGLEAFPETYNPGYFLVKLAGWLLAALMALQAVRDLRRGRPS